MNTANKSNRDAYRWWFTMICSFGWLAGSAAGALSQVLTATIQANAVYTLKALVGTWSTKSPTYAVQLVDSNNGVVLSQATGSCNLGSLVEVATPPYRANSHPEYIGHTLKIVLIGSGEEDNFDRVALDYALVSQPGALLLLLED